MTNTNYFAELNAINVGDKIEKKNGLSYLSWAWAWGELKKCHPLSYYTIYEDQNGMNYFTDGKTCWVKTGVTVVFLSGSELEHIEYLPIMDLRNASIPKDKVTSFDVNKAIQRSLTKAAARHGLGLYIYAGEDLPEEEKEAQESQAKELEVAKAKIIALCKALIKCDPENRKQVEDTVRKHNNDDANPKTIKDLKAAMRVLDDLENIKTLAESEG